jgi:ribosome-binding protein aMBF1 (putative translation factor)
MARGAETTNGAIGSPRGKAAVSPLGTPASEAAARRSQRSAAYAAERARLAPYEQIARIVIRRRMELNLTQQQVAKRMGTSYSAISRIESGRHPTKQETLARLAQALEMNYVHGFEIKRAKQPQRELISVC